MIATFYHLGKVLEKKYPDYFHPWQNPFGGKEGNAKVLVFEVEKGKLKSSEPRIENFSEKPEFLKRYLFRESTAKGTNIVPTLRLSKSTAKKIKQSIKNYKLDFVDKEQLSQIENYFANNKPEKGTSYLVTFKVNGKFFGEMNDYVELFLDKAYESYYTKNYGKVFQSRNNKSVCSLSGQIGTVYGFVDALGFTVKSNSFMRNGFDRTNAYKMFPVSPEAVRVLDGAMAFANKNLLQSFYKIKKKSKNQWIEAKYYVLPHFISVVNDETAVEVINAFVEKSINSLNNPETARENALMNKEGLLKEIAEEKELGQQGIYYEFLFYEDRQAQTALLLHMPDVMPSRIKMLFEKKRTVEKTYEYLTNRENYKFYVTLFSIRSFFADEELTHPFFWKLMEAVFCNAQVSEKVFRRFLIDKWRVLFKRRNDDSWKFDSSVREGFLTYLYLRSIGLFHSNNKNESAMDTTLNNSNAENALEFIAQHKSFFKSDYKKAVFLTGCLTQKLASFQPNQAILKKVNNLHIDHKVLKKLLPTLVIKLKQHDREYPDVKNLEESASGWIVSNQDIDNDEISFTFTLGLVLQRKFDEIARAKKKDNNEANS